MSCRMYESPQNLKESTSDRFTSEKLPASAHQALLRQVLDNKVQKLTLHDVDYSSPAAI